MFIMLNHFAEFRRWFFGGVEKWISSVSLDKKRNDYLMMPDNFRDFYSQDYSVNIIYVALLAYYMEGSPYYKDKYMLNLACDAAEFISDNYQHADGSFDLRDTNFHDASTCGFTVRWSIGPELDLLRKYTKHTDEEDRLDERLTDIIFKAGKAMSRLGFHTPNHRWVISSALSYAYKLTGEPEFLDAINGFLSEGIDINSDGEYTERSTGCYNVICNESFYKLAYNLGRPELLAPVEKNLTLMHSLFEADGTTCTLSSQRQDVEKLHYASEYYTAYLYMALTTGSSEFAYYADSFLSGYLADEIKAIPGTYYPIHCELLYWFLMNPDWEEKQKSITAEKPVRERSVFLGENGMARVYDGNRTLTVLKARHPDFLMYHFGCGYLCVRLAGAFFGDEHAQFRAKEIIPLGNGAYKLISHEECGYRSRLETPPETSDWHLMDHSKRKTINIRDFGFEVTVTPIKNGFSLDVVSKGEAGVPVKLEFLMPPTGRYDTPHVSMFVNPGDYLIQKDGKCDYYLQGKGRISIDGGYYKSSCAPDMRGSVRRSDSVFTVCMTEDSPACFHVDVTYTD